MSGLIRSRSDRAQAVRHVRASDSGSLAAALVSPAERERWRLAAEIDGLRAALTQMERNQVDVAADIEEAYARGEAKGHAAGLSEGLARTSAGLSLLEAGIQAAHAEFKDRLGEMERLAVALAIVAAERIVGEEARDRALIVRTLRQSVARVEQGAVIRVLVSPQDFPDGDALAGLQASLAGELANAQFVVGADLGPGQCRFAMTLGEAEVGPAQQWARLASELALQAEAAA